MDGYPLVLIPLWAFLSYRLDCLDPPSRWQDHFRLPLYHPGYHLLLFLQKVRELSRPLDHALFWGIKLPVTLVAHFKER